MRLGIAGPAVWVDTVLNGFSRLADMSKYPSAVLAVVRYSETQGTHEMRLYDADGTNLGYHQYIDVGFDFFVDEADPGVHPPTGAAIATVQLMTVGLGVIGDWSRGDIGYEAAVLSLAGDKEEHHRA
jgi:hypothetical protein